MFSYRAGVLHLPGPLLTVMAVVLIVVVVAAVAVAVIPDRSDPSEGPNEDDDPEVSGP